MDVLNILGEIADAGATAKVLAEKLIELDPSWKPLNESTNLYDYLSPAFDWALPEREFPYAKRLAEIITEEVRLCYGDETARHVAKQLVDSFCVETGVHVSLPRLYDKATVTSSALDNYNTVVFQGALLAAAVRLAKRQKISLSCMTGRICAGNLNNARYFQPDLELAAPIYSAKSNWLQNFRPPLNSMTLNKLFPRNSLTEGGRRRLQILLDSVERHRDSFSRQAVVAYPELGCVTTPSLPDAPRHQPSAVRRPPPAVRHSLADRGAPDAGHRSCSTARDRTAHPRQPEGAAP